MFSPQTRNFDLSRLRSMRDEELLTFYDEVSASLQRGKMQNIGFIKTSLRQEILRRMKQLKVS